MTKKSLLLIFSAFLLVPEAFSEKEPEKAVWTTGVSGMVYAISYQDLPAGVVGSYSAFRVRPFFGYTLKDVEVYLRLEIDQLFGGQGGTKTDEDVAVGADKRVIDVDNAYVSLNPSALKGLKLTAGVALYDFPLVFGDHVPLFQASYDFGPASVTAAYIKIYEGALFRGSDDAEVLVLDLLFEPGEHKIRPGFFLHRSGKNAQHESWVYKDSFGMIGALSLSFVFDAFSLEASAAYAMGQDSGASKKYAGYALDFAPVYRIAEGVSVGAFFTLISGDHPSTAGTDESFINATISGQYSGINLWRFYILEDGGTLTLDSPAVSAGKYDNERGYVLAGLVFNGTYQGFSAKFQAAYALAHQKPLASGGSRSMGLEFNLNLSYEASPGAVLFVEGAFLKTGAFFKTYYPAYGSVQNAFSLNAGMTFEL